MYSIFFIHSSVNGHLGCFHVLSVVNSAVLNIEVLIPFQTVFFSRYMPRSRLQCERPGFDPWVGKLPWRRAWQPTPVFLPAESQWTEEPGGLQSIGLQRVRLEWSDRAWTQPAYVIAKYDNTKTTQIENNNTNKIYPKTTRNHLKTLCIYQDTNKGEMNALYRNA